jgi:hexosaminidase
VEGSNLGREPIGLLWAPPKEEPKPVSLALPNTTPVDPVGLLGRVYQGTEPASDPVVEQVDPNFELRVHVLPTGRPYTLEWTGALRADRDGRYGFSLTSLGASTLWIDGAELARKDVAEGLAESAVELRRGWHDIRIRFVDTVGFSHVTAFWQPPGAQREPIPPSALRPWPADRVQLARPEDANLP